MTKSILIAVRSKAGVQRKYLAKDCHVFLDNVLECLALLLNRFSKSPSFKYLEIKATLTVTFAKNKCKFLTFFATKTHPYNQCIFFVENSKIIYASTELKLFARDVPFLGKNKTATNNTEHFTSVV